MQVANATDDEEVAPVKVTTVKPIEAYGKYKNQQVKNIFKEWKASGPKADIPDELIEFIINFEFAESIPPSRKQLLDSVLREPKLKEVVKDRFDPFTGKKLPAEQRWRFNPENGANYSDKGLHYEQGQYVEFLGNDMEWHLASVRRIVKLAPEDWEPENEDDEPDYEYYYNIGAESLINPKNVRAPEEGLKLIFGYRPWVWQQWAVLQVETTTRFCEDHDMDFQAINFRKAAKDLWDYWFNNKKNAEFKEHVLRVEEEYPGSQDKLVAHILTPFVLMDEVAKNKDKWSLEGRVNVFMYISFLGSGFITCVVTLFIQFVVPALLMQTALTIEPGVTRFDPSYHANETAGWDMFCQGNGQIQGRIMNITVLLLYVIRVLPTLMYAFFTKGGSAETAEDRVNELRRIIWLQGDDTVWQQIGYKVNKYMNGLYVAAIMSIMLFILFLTDDIFSIILNALALEFVHSLDEELASGDWYDPGARWITAGATELVFRATLRLDFLMSWRVFCKQFDIPEDVYREAFGGKPKSLKDYHQGRKDLTNPALMSQKMRYYSTAAHIAKKLRNKLALWNFEERVECFGIIDKLLAHFQMLDVGMFSRFRDYCVWSRWNRVLYLGAVPSKNEGKWNQTLTLATNRIDPFKDDALSRNTSHGAVVDVLGRGAGGLGRFLKKSVATVSGNVASDRILNYEEDTEQTALVRFIHDLMDILLFQGVLRSIGVAINRKEYGAIVFRLVDGVFDWFSYQYQVMFPFILLFFFYLVIQCY